MLSAKVHEVEVKATTESVLITSTHTPHIGKADAHAGPPVRIDNRLHVISQVLGLGSGAKRYFYPKLP